MAAPAIVQSGQTTWWTNGAITTPTTAFTDTTDAPFSTATLTTQNPNVTVQGAGVAGADLVTTISARVSTSAVTLAGSAGTTVGPAASWVWGSIAGGTTGTNEIEATFASSNTRGNLLVAKVQYNPTFTTLATIADSIGNVIGGGGWQKIFSFTGTDYNFVWFACPNCLPGNNTVKVTCPAANAFPSLAIFEVSGADPSLPFSQGVGATGNGTALSVSITPKRPQQILLCATGVDHTITAGSAGFTVSTVDPFGDVYQTRINPAVSAQNVTATQNTTGNWDITVVAFDASTSPVLGVQQRAPGFPPNAPLPGIPTLGKGLLIAPQPATPPTPTPPLPVLPIQQRAPGFPLGAPLPGIVLLGSGILQPTPSTPTTPAQPLWFGTE